MAIAAQGPSETSGHSQSARKFALVVPQLWSAWLYPDSAQFAQGWRLDRRFQPAMPADEHASRYRGWREAVAHIVAPMQGH